MARSSAKVTSFTVWMPRSLGRWGQHTSTGEVSKIESGRRDLTHVDGGPCSVGNLKVGGVSRKETQMKPQKFLILSRAQSDLSLSGWWEVVHLVCQDVEVVGRRRGLWVRDLCSQLHAKPKRGNQSEAAKSLTFRGLFARRPDTGRDFVSHVMLCILDSYVLFI